MYVGRRLEQWRLELFPRSDGKSTAGSCHQQDDAKRIQIWATGHCQAPNWVNIGAKALLAKA